MPDRLVTLLSAPHRLLFLPGALQLVLVMLCWLTLLAGSPEVVLPTVLAPSAAHAWLMLYGVFPFFIFGFLFTAVPNWLEAARPKGSACLAVALPMTMGAMLFYPALYLPALAVLAVGLHLSGWAAALAVLWRLLRPEGAVSEGQRPRTPRPLEPPPAQPIDRRHAWIALLTCTLGALGEAAYLHWLLSDALPAWRLANTLAVWGFLTPLFLTVCHRMLPWFTSRVVSGYRLFRPSWALWGLLAGCLAHAILEAIGLSAGLWLADLPLTALVSWLALRWYHPAVHRVRLLAMLHLSLPWAAFAFALSAIDSLLGWSGATTGLGLAPLHALGIGFFGSMLLAMATRVSLGHSGRKLEADRLTWVLFWLVQTAALVRIGPELLPLSQVHTAWLLAQGLWLAAFLPWGWRYAPMYWRPRVDGKPG